MMGPIKHLEANESSRVHQTSAETMWIVSLGPRMFWGTRATNFFHLHGKNGGCRAENFKHRGQLQIQTGTVPKKMSCKPGFCLHFTLRHAQRPKGSS